MPERNAMIISLLTNTTANVTGTPEGIPPYQNINSLNSSGLKSFQATVQGSGALAATVNVYGTNDQIGFILLGTIILSGSTLVTDWFQSTSLFGNYQAVLSGLSGTGATVNVTMVA